MRTLADWIADTLPHVPTPEPGESLSPDQRLAARLVERDGATYFRCRCGRLVSPDMVLWVEGVTARGRREDRCRCDGCWRRWLARGEIDPDQLRAQTGQPARAPGAPW